MVRPVFIRCRHWSPSWNEWTHSTPYLHTLFPLQATLIVSFKPRTRMICHKNCVWHLAKQACVRHGTASPNFSLARLTSFRATVFLCSTSQWVILYQDWKGVIRPRLHSVCTCNFHLPTLSASNWITELYYACVYAWFIHKLLLIVFVQKKLQPITIQFTLGKPGQRERPGKKEKRKAYSLQSPVNITTVRYGMWWHLHTLHKESGFHVSSRCEVYYSHFSFCTYLLKYF